MNKNSNKKQIIYLVIMIAFISTILIGSSYAWFVVTDDAEKDVVVKVGSLNLSFQGDENLELEDQVPINTEDIGSLTGYNFTITNTGSIKADFAVKLVDVGMDELRIDDNYVRYNLSTGGKTIKNDLLSNLNDNVLITGTLNKNGSISYNLKLYLDEDNFDRNAADKKFYKRFEVTTTQFVEAELSLNGIPNEINQGDSYDIPTSIVNGTAECSVNSNVVTNTSTLSVGENNIVCVVTENDGTTKNVSKSIKVK